jgi:hypothetical protein
MWLLAAAGSPSIATAIVTRSGGRGRPPDSRRDGGATFAMQDECWSQEKGSAKALPFTVYKILLDKHFILGHADAVAAALLVAQQEFQSRGDTVHQSAELPHR